MRNLFIRTHELRHGSTDDPLGSDLEDTLTDATAFYLASDPDGLKNWFIGGLLFFP
ncbi:MAG: hypothetical protein GY854_25405 [Deltaproteobacteria bacterium]|nr:hypothetical protein [Deltaproteobacteria bacterium]